MESELFISPVALDLHQRRCDPWWFRMELLGGALATSTKCYLIALPDKNVFLFGLSSDEGGGVLFRHAVKVCSYQLW